MNSFLEQRQQLMVRKRELDASLSKPVLSEAEQKEQLLQQVKDDNAHTATFMRNIGDAEKRIAQIQKVGRCQACNRTCSPKIASEMGGTRPISGANTSIFLADSVHDRRTWTHLRVGEEQRATRSTSTRSFKRRTRR